jgi:PAS domain S-box-containing protein
MKANKNISQLSGTSFAISTDAYQDEYLKKIQGKYSPVSVLLIMVIGIAVAEIFAMVVVYLVRHLPYYQQVLVDTMVITTIAFPILYFLSFKPILTHVKQRHQAEQVLRSRLRIVQYANAHTLNEILQFTLDELEALTGSEAGYFHFVETDQKTINLQAWSRNTLQNLCRMNDVEGHYSVEWAGIWADCVRQRKVVVHNDYESLPNRKGLPDGHAPIIREMAVPIMRDETIVAVLGVGNKPEHYSTDDVEVVSTLADFTWDIIKQKQVDLALRASEEKFRTLVDWTYDWENWIDPQGNIVYTSPACERITGYGPAEFIRDPDLLIRVVHPDDRDLYRKHHTIVHDETVGVNTLEYRIIGRNGAERWIEHVCRPLFGTDNRYLGRRISNRDVTERKQAESEIRERNQKEKVLTQTIHTMQLDIARDLHDTVGQNISFLRMKLDYLAAKKSIKKADMQAEIQGMTKAANESYDLMRGTLAVLQSGDSADLFRVFSRYAEQIEERSAFKVTFLVQGEGRSLSAKRMRQLFYIFREALNNIEKHAEATLVDIKINWGGDHLGFTASDNGKGFDVSNVQYGSHFGLKFMRDRVELLNGSIEILSELSVGTTIVIRVPYG